VLTVRTGALLLALAAFSVWLRTRSLEGTLWIDEALSRGISSHGVGELPGLLRQDGSPPLYYLLLHWWMAAAGDGEAALRWLSVVFAVACVPASFWAGRVAGGERVGWIAATVAAVIPFLTIYGQEARMYSLVALLSIVLAGAFVRGFVDGSTAWQVVFAIVLAALLYTHAWGLFVLVGAVAALTVCGRSALRRGVLAVAAAAVAFAPWLPTLWFQIEHTGAPWSRTPAPWSLLEAFPQALASGAGALVLVAVSVAGLLRAPLDARARTVVLALVVLAVTTLVVAWLGSQFTPSWANRYLAVVVGPIVVLAALGLAAARRVGLAALVVLAVLWIGFRAPAEKSNAAELAERIRPLAPGTLVVAAQPEQVPLLAYYLGSGSFATPLGIVENPLAVDWRDALTRLRRASPERSLAPLVARLASGERLVLVTPLGAQPGWGAPWQREVLARATEWQRFASESSRLRRIREVVPEPSERARTDVRATIYEVV
jgi:uncharacterized membrane protein